VRIQPTARGEVTGELVLARPSLASGSTYWFADEVDELELEVEPMFGHGFEPFAGGVTAAYLVA
jgi:hypothetical protein